MHRQDKFYQVDPSTRFFFFPFPLHHVVSHLLRLSIVMAKRFLV